jgi:hypothetical protein
VFALGVTGGIVREHGQSSLVSSLEKILEIATQALLIAGFLTSSPLQTSALRRTPYRGRIEEIDQSSRSKCGV